MAWIKAKATAIIIIAIISLVASNIVLFQQNRIERQAREVLQNTVNKNEQSIKEFSSFQESINKVTLDLANLKSKINQDLSNQQDALNKILSEDEHAKGWSDEKIPAQIQIILH